MRNCKLLVISERTEVELLSAKNGHQGVGLAEAELPDLILLDLQLPDMNGVELIDRLKANDATRKIPVVLIAGAGD